MAENKQFQLILKHLIDKYAYSLVFYEEPGDKCLYLEYKNVYDVRDLRKECSEKGIELRDGTLSMNISNIQRETRSPVFAFQKMQGIGGNKYFFIGEILRLCLKDGQCIDIVKIDNERWWITYVTGMYNDLSASFIKIEQNIGSGTILNTCGMSLEIESVAFFVPTYIFQCIDKILFPPYYCIETPENFSLEEVLIKPLYEEIVNSQTNKIPFSFWRQIAERAYRNGMDSKTIWYISNAVARNYKKMYLWS